MTLVCLTDQCVANESYVIESFILLVFLKVNLDCQSMLVYGKINPPKLMSSGWVCVGLQRYD